MNNSGQLAANAFDYTHKKIGQGLLIHADCFEWMRRLPDDCVHAVITDPPYGVKEYELEQLAKRNTGKGGVWRIPPSFDGHVRAPLPRFTALDRREREHLRSTFVEWSKSVTRILRPGGHVFVATNAFIAQLLYEAVVEGGLEFRGQIIRLVRTLRGGDRPKNFEKQFPNVSSMPKGCYEPWGLFRKPLPTKMTVGQCLSKFQTGGLRRTLDNRPFEDVIASERTPRREREIADHPSIKPQSFLRQLVFAALPLGEGIVVDPFMGSGSTIAAANALGFTSIGVERHPDYFKMACRVVPKLSALEVAQVDLKTGIEHEASLF